MQSILTSTYKSLQQMILTVIISSSYHVGILCGNFWYKVTFIVTKLKILRENRLLKATLLYSASKITYAWDQLCFANNKIELNSRKFKKENMVINADQWPPQYIIVVNHRIVQRLFGRAHCNRLSHLHQCQSSSWCDRYPVTMSGKYEVCAIY